MLQEADSAEASSQAVEMADSLVKNKLQQDKICQLLSEIESDSDSIGKFPLLTHKYTELQILPGWRKKNQYKNNAGK